MLRLPTRWASWIPALVWMSLIFIGSTDLLASSRTSRFLEPLIRWLVPDISGPSLASLQLLVRKAGHAFEYAVLALLTWWALAPVGAGSTTWIWTRRRAWLAWGLAATYALSDEFHQTFVRSREGRLRDVIIDATGAAMALLTLRFFIHRFHRECANKDRGGLTTDSTDQHG
jgi:VanZ family protein